MVQKPYTLNKQMVKTKQINLNYLLYLPSDYHESEEKFPLVLFLHGAGERGSDLELVKRNGPPKLAETEEFPFILLSPQCPLRIPRYSNWLLELDSVMELLEQIIREYRVDENRIYLTGLSMGGYGSWELAIQYPDRFAAIAPICGGGSTENIHLLKDTPVWVFHGAKDEIVYLGESQEMVNALRAIDGNVQFTIYPEAGHDSWTETYNNKQFYNWLLNQSLSK